MIWISRLWANIKGSPMPTKFTFSARSLTALTDVHPDLVKVAKRALELTTIDFLVTEGRRSAARQKELVAQGASRTMQSRHLTGHAIDVAAYQSGKVHWNSEAMREIAKAFKAAAAELGIPIKWGGDWKTFKDTPHFELDRERYPA